MLPIIKIWNDIMTVYNSYWHSEKQKCRYNAFNVMQLVCVPEPRLGLIIPTISFSISHKKKKAEKQSPMMLKNVRTIPMLSHSENLASLVSVFDSYLYSVDEKCNKLYVKLLTKFVNFNVTKIQVTRKSQFLNNNWMRIFNT